MSRKRELVGANIISLGVRKLGMQRQRRETEREKGARRPSLRTSAGIRHSWLASLSPAGLAPPCPARGLRTAGTAQAPAGARTLWLALARGCRCAPGRRSRRGATRSSTEGHRAAGGTSGTETHKEGRGQHQSVSSSTR